MQEDNIEKKTEENSKKTIKNTDNLEIKIQKFGVMDLDEYINMTKEFYLSGATVTPFNLEVTKRNFKEMIKKEIDKENDGVSGFFIKKQGKTAGFVILSFMWSAEVGGKAVFVEELFVKDEFRKQGIATTVLSLIVSKFKSTVSRFRLEVCKTNVKAIELYKQLGFEYLDYKQMILDNL